MTEYLTGIIICIFVSEAACMLLPKGNFKKYMRLISGIIVSLVILTPFLTQDGNSISFDINEYFDEDEYTNIQMIDRQLYEDHILDIYERNGNIADD